jgi:hypothetical protein
MGHYVDESRWLATVQRSDWYLHLRDEYEDLLALARRSDRTTAKHIADEVYSFFERGLAERHIVVGATESDWDAERHPLDTAVIHHTQLPPGITWQRLDAIHLTRVYARYYADPVVEEAWIHGLPITSGHLRGGREVFYAYHWLVRTDGTLERLLDDRETGWHAGDWGINCRSIGICIDDDLSERPPAHVVIEAIANLLRDHYPGVTAQGICGHREINPTTTCPGNRFLPEWKTTLLQRRFLPGCSTSST